MQASEHLPVTHTQTHTLSSQERGGSGGRLHEAPAASARLVTFKGSCCVNQVRPVQASGSVWEGHEARVAELGPVRQGAVREPKLICRDRRSLQSVSGPGLSLHQTRGVGKGRGERSYKEKLI